MRISRLSMGTLYLVTGSLHFLATNRYIAIMPPYLPAHRTLVLLSGAAEIAGGLGILTPIPHDPAHRSLGTRRPPHRRDARKHLHGHQPRKLPHHPPLDPLAAPAPATPAHLLGMALHPSCLE